VNEFFFLGAMLWESAAKNATSEEKSAAKAVESEALPLPINETRVNELLEDLKRRDLEVECLKEEIGELRGYYKEQQVFPLLWDDGDDENDSPAGGDGDGSMAQGEKTLEQDGILDKWGVQQLGVSLKVGTEENTMMRDEDGDDDDNPTEDETPQVSSEIDVNALQEESSSTSSKVPVMTSSSQSLPIWKTHRRPSPPILPTAARSRLQRRVLSTQESMTTKQ